MPYEKVGQNEPVCIADEVPFDIPESWEWVRLGAITSVLGGKRIPAGRKLTQENTGHPYIRISDMKDDRVLIDSIQFVPEDVFPNISKYIINKEDVFITVAGTIGRVGKVSKELDGANLTENADRLIFTEINQDWLLRALQSSLIQDQIINATTKVGQPKLAIARIEKFLIALPPIEEQKRIIKKLDAVIPYIDQYNKIKSTIDTLNNKFPELLKKSILQEAVQGKLVPQVPSDEPASVLLERIRAEKERLIQESKIKRDKHESVIYRRDNSHYEKHGSEEVCIDDEIPFEIPENWCWSRLSSLCKSIADGDHQAPPQTVSGIPFIVISNVSAGKIDFTNTRFVPQEYYDNLPENRIPHRNDILFTVTGSYGIVIPVDVDNFFCFQRHIALLKPLQIATNFLTTWLSTPIVYEQCKNYATGTAQKTVSLNSLKNILIPVPPAKEQARILKRLKNILYLITL